jgi:DNA mismatch repair protein MutS2
MGLQGTLAGLHGGEAEVEVLGKRVRARVSDLRVATKPGGAAPPAGRVNVNVQLQPRGENSSSEINLLGCTVEEALARMDRFLDNLLLADFRSVRVIHGYGTGQLRRAIIQYLRAHPLVSNYQEAPPEQGGGGVTLVELKD